MKKLISILLLSLLIQQGFSQNPMMINLSPITDWGTESVFRDEFKMSRDWIAQHVDSGWGKGDPLEVDSLGWVTSLQEGQFAEALLFSDGERNSGEEFVILYEGEGKINIRSGSVLAEEPGRMEIAINAGTTFFVQIRETNPDNYLRNIRMVRPEHEAIYETEPFHQQFLDRWNGYFGIRFMPWMHTNDAICSTWTDRIQPTSNTQTSKKGVSIEHMVDLSNQTGTHPWFSLPHNADDDYIRQFAQLVKDSLDPSLNVYIEYSNEVWNSMFSASQYCREKGVALNLDSDPHRAQLFYQTVRSLELFAIWEEVFGGADRLVRVMASQASNPWTGEQVLNYNYAWKSCDVLAIAPYFGGFLGHPDTQNEVATWSLDRIFEVLDSVVAYPDRDDMGDNMEMLNSKFSGHDLRLIAYEGGQHMVGFWGAEDNKELEELFKAANRDPRMRGIYTKYLDHWRAVGGNEFAIFQSIERYSKWGSWGLKERETDPDSDSPKYMAMLDFIENNPVWWETETAVSQQYHSASTARIYQSGSKIILDQSEIQHATLKLFNAQGRELYRQKMARTGSQLVGTLPATAAGFYILKINNLATTITVE